MATTKQIDFATDLLKNRVHESPPVRLETLTNDEASRLIDYLLSCPRKPKLKAPRAEDLGVTEGWYKGPKGEIAKVQRAVHGSGNLYAKRLVLTNVTKPFRPNDYMPGYVPPDEYEAEFVYEKGLIGLIYQMGWEKLTLEEAKKFGRLYGVCCACGATLTDEESIEYGIGPVCRGRF